eukprot:TRINITY_DN18865_c0_g1_i1.p1 TRINITY_DN18865_c0_g1~~TRINITY_DN18865_c0_g1_i1.p1  ORF type:complete len:519 (+),score=144.39 TRINITY_DN18865_c0_g1_i1:251-1807(+)
MDLRAALLLLAVIPILKVAAYSGNGTNFCKAAGFAEADCIADLESYATQASSKHQPYYHKSMLPYHAWNHAFQYGHSARMFLKKYGGVDLNASLFDEAIALAGFFHDIGYPRVMGFNGYSMKQVWASCKTPHPIPRAGPGALGRYDIYGTQCIGETYGRIPLYREGHESYSLKLYLETVATNDPELPPQFLELREPRYMILTALNIACSKWNATEATGAEMALLELSAGYPLAPDLEVNVETCETSPLRPDMAPGQVNDKWRQILNCVRDNMERINGASRTSLACSAARYADFANVFQEGFICYTTNLWAEYAAYGGARANSGQTATDPTKDGVLGEEQHFFWNNEVLFIKEITEEYVVGPDFQPLHGRYTPDDVASIEKALADTVVIRDRVDQLYASAPHGSSVYLSDIHALEAIPLFETSCNFVDYAYRTRQLMGLAAYLPMWAAAAHLQAQDALQTSPVIWTLIAFAATITVGLLILVVYRLATTKKGKAQGWGDKLQEMEMLVKKPAREAAHSV